MTGGSSSSANNNAAGAILPAELSDPATGAWTAMASLTIPRIYHSVALLLPDGRVLAGGGDRPSGSRFASHRNVQIYSPPYLFKGPRPTIASVAAKRVGYGESLSVATPDAVAIARVSLVRLSAVTHSFNMNQRIKFLPFERAGEGRSPRQSPPAGGTCRPGTTCCSS